MRFKKLIGGLTLAAVMALGIGAALSVNKAGEAKAATSETMIYVKVGSSTVWNEWGFDSSKLKVKLWDGDSNEAYVWEHTKTAANGGFDELVINEVTYYGFSRSYYAGKTAGYVYYDHTDWGANYSATFTFEAASEGQNLLTVSGGSNTGPVSPSVEWGTLVVLDTFTVTKHAVVDGVLQGEAIGSSSVTEGDTFDIPDRLNREGYHFGGWFKNQACTEAYTAQAVNADLDIYAKYTTLSKDSYIYYVSRSASETPNMIHTWGGDVEYASHDVLITSIAGVQEVHGVMNFEGTEQMIYKIPISSESGDTNFQFHYNNWEYKSPELLLVAGNAYVWSDDPYEEEAAGDALDFVLALEAKRTAVSAAGDIKEDSVCGISTADATNLCKAYNALSDDAREDFVDVSDVWTYDRQDSSKEAHVTIYEIMEELASKASITLKGHASVRFVSVFGSEASNNSFVIIAIIALVSVSAIAVLVVYKKRKHE